MWRAIISSSFVGMTQAATRLAGVLIREAFAWFAAVSSSMPSQAASLQTRSRSEWLFSPMPPVNTIASSSAERGGERPELAADAISKELDRDLRIRLDARFERAHVAGDSGYPEQARLLIDELLDGAGVHLQLVHQIKHHPRIEVAATRPHGQPVDRSEAHGARNASPAGHRAHARTVAEVQHDRLAERSLRVVFRKRLCDVLVGQSVETVATHAALGKPLGQCEQLRDRRLRTMEGRVEARHLGKLRQTLKQQSDWREVVRLVQRRQGNVLFKRRQNLRIDEHRLRIFGAPVHDAMAHSSQSQLSELAAHEPHQMVERTSVPELDAVTPGFLRDKRAGAVLGDKVRRRMDALVLATGLELELAVLLREQRELDARGTGVDDGDSVGHFQATTFPLRVLSPSASRPRTKQGGS